MRIVGEKRRVPMGPKTYRLRSYVAVAQKQYYCDRCNGTIQPGEMYQAEVYAVRMRMSAEELHQAGIRRCFIDVERRHTSPECPEPDPFEHWNEDWAEDLGTEDLADAA